MFVPGVLLASLRAHAGGDTVNVDLTALEVCIERLPSAACEEAIQIGVPLCPGVFVGLAPAGGDCTVDDDCSAPLSCVRDQGLTAGGTPGLCGAGGPSDPNLAGSAEGGG